MRIFPTDPTAAHIRERKNNAPRKRSIPPIFASGLSEKNTTSQFGFFGSEGVGILGIYISSCEKSF